jgi:N-acetylglutamate synthase-like GNAT family acetyltransferase
VTAPLVTRPARQADVPGLRALATAAFSRYTERIGRPAAPMSADYDAAVDQGQVWVAETGGELAGFVVLVPQAGCLLLDIIAVRPADQGRGVGARLLGLADEQARRQGLAEIQLCTNEVMTENLAYYPRRGYTETHRAEQHGFRRVFFSRVLPPGPAQPGRRTAGA